MGLHLKMPVLQIYASRISNLYIWTFEATIYVLNTLQELTRLTYFDNLFAIITKMTQTLMWINIQNIFLRRWERGTTRQLGKLHTILSLMHIVNDCINKMRDNKSYTSGYIRAIVQINLISKNVRKPIIEQPYAFSLWVLISIIEKHHIF